jgi:biofilm PGA synthesis N-glycosyltransferase PgaC
VATRTSTTYGLVTPARNEAANIRRLAASLAEQSTPPKVWVIVDDGSTDETLAIATEFAAEYNWVRALSPSSDQVGPREYGRRVAKEALAFERGLAALGDPPDLVVKVDADVSVPPEFFERLVGEFEADAALGIASGICYELDEGSWRPRYATGSNPRGATRAYRWQCLQEILPLERRLGWDGIDAAKACARGWSARSINDLPFYHHRKTGERDRGVRAWAASGETLHYLGYRPSYVFLKVLFRSVKEPTFIGVAWGYVAALLTRKQRCDDDGLRAYVRSQQRLRAIPQRAREALGRSASG